VSANLDLVRAIYADWERGDYSSASWSNPGIEYTFAAWGPFETQTWIGLAGMAEGLRSRISVFNHARGEAEEYRELDERRVLVLDRRSGVAKGSGITIGDSGVPMLGATLFHVDGAKVTKIVDYWDRTRALADLGLEE
jgi:hypothetical protein